jgi:hypothetical protein
MKIVNLFKEKISQFLKFIKKSSENKVKYKDLNYGDVLWVYLKKTKEFTFEGRHRTRPFIVIDCNKRYVYGLTATHKEGNIMTIFMNSVNSSVLIQEIIKIKRHQIVDRKATLSESNISILSKRLSRYHKKSKYRPLFQSKINYSMGDIILYNDKRYVIYYLNNKEMTLIEQSDGLKEGFMSMVINGKTLYLSTKFIVIPYQRVFYLSTISSIELSKLKQEKNKFKSCKSEEKKNDYKLNYEVDDPKNETWQYEFKNIW